MTNIPPNPNLTALIHWLVEQIANSELVEQLGSEHVERIVQLIFYSDASDPTSLVDEYVDSLADQGHDVHDGAAIFAELAMAIYFREKEKGSRVKFNRNYETNGQSAPEIT